MNPVKPEASSYSLRSATLEDLPQILPIENDSYPYPWTEENFRAEFEKPYSNFYVLTDDETDTHVAGYIVYWTMMDECQVMNVAVAQSQRRAGHGRVLLAHAVKDALRKNLRKVTLEVRKNNQAAIQLYQQNNFNITNVRKGFYSNGEDAYHMELTLDSNVVDAF